MSYPNNNPQQGYYAQGFNPQQLLQGQVPGQGQGQGQGQYQPNTSQPQQAFQLSLPQNQRQASGQRVQQTGAPGIIPPALVQQLQNRLPPQQAQAFQQLLAANPALQQQAMRQARPPPAQHQSSFAYGQQSQGQARPVPQQRPRPITSQTSGSPMIQPPSLFPNQGTTPGSSRPATPAAIRPSMGQQLPSDQQRPSIPITQAAPSLSQPLKPLSNGSSTPIAKPRPKQHGTPTPTFASSATPTRPREATPSVLAPTPREGRVDPPKPTMSQVQFALPSSSQSVRSPITHSAPVHHAPVVEKRQKKDDTISRGQLRGEIAKMMYGCGDVLNPEVDTVDYMEDLVIEFLSDLCRPVPPIRPTPTSSYQATPLTSNVIRYRLSSTPSLRKYLNRYDTMLYATGELAAQKRVMQSTETPADLVAAVGKEYLEIDVVGDGEGVKRKRGRPAVKHEEGGGEGGEGDKKKPGPRKGWKKGVKEEEGAAIGVKQKRAYAKRKRVGSSVPVATPARV